MANSNKADLLHEFGIYLLTVDTRLFIISAVIISTIILAISYWRTKSRPSTHDLGFLFLAFLQVYSAAVVLGALLLTDPPAVDRLGQFERQMAGMLTAIVLIGGIVHSINSVLRPPNLPTSATRSGRSSRPDPKSGDA